MFQAGLIGFIFHSLHFLLALWSIKKLNKKELLVSINFLAENK
jgi:hypothetical protein